MVKDYQGLFRVNSTKDLFPGRKQSAEKVPTAPKQDSCRFVRAVISGRPSVCFRGEASLLHVQTHRDCR